MKYLFFLALSVGLNLVIVMFASPNFYATMGFDTLDRTLLTIGKLLLGIILFGYVIPKSSKKQTN